MNKLILNLLTLSSLLLTSPTSLANQASHVTSLKEMFQKVTIEKNEKAIPNYYAKDFELYTNGNKFNYNEFNKLHMDIYKTAIQYKVRYDNDAFVEQGDNVAARLFITTSMPNEEPKEIEVILVAKYKGHKLYRLWELTYPDWSKMKDFENKIK
jgi:hypothetical protein